MIEHEVTRTLVKSQPEVWAQCSEAESLGRHLSGSFGEIRITRLEPEHSVAWEGEEISGTVRIEPSAWGTRVTMTVQVDQVEAPPEAVPELEEPEQEAPPVQGEAVEEPEASDEGTPEEARDEETRPVTFLARLRARLHRARQPGPPPEEAAEPTADEPEFVAPAEPEPMEPPEPVAEALEPVAEAPEPPPEDESPDTTAALNAALESMGQAHHRPFSRA